MYTYQDWLEVAGASENDRMAFIKKMIDEHCASVAYQLATEAQEYFAGRNTTIMRLQKLIYNAAGQAVPDLVSANHKLATRFFYRDIVQENQTLLGNGVKWTNKATETKLGDDFDDQLADAGEYALVDAVSFGFFNYDHVDIFRFTEFAPLFDEENGALRAGARFWQLAPEKPLRVVMYEEDGYTSYIWRSDGGAGEVLQEKRTYIEKTKESPADGLTIYDGANYPAFPIVPFYGNKLKQSELEPLREKIDAFDLISSGYANDTDDCNTIFWTVKNASAMDDQDLVEMLDKLRKLHAANFDGDAEPVAHTIEQPYEAREHQLDRLEAQLYRDAMALDVEKIANGAVNIPQIKAAFEPLNEKLDLYEKQVRKFIKGILKVAGIDDKPTFERSLITNQSEEIDDLLKMAPYLTDDYITTKGMTMMGDKDQIETVMKNKDKLDFDRFNAQKNQQTPPPATESQGEEGQPAEE